MRLLNRTAMVARQRPARAASRARFLGSRAAKSSGAARFAFAGLGLGAVGVGFAFSTQEAQAVSIDEIPEALLWAAIRSDIVAIMDDENAVNPGKDNFPGNSGGGGDIGPMFVRLAWHCSGTYCKSAKNGGSDGGTMRFKPACAHGGNAGLGHARALLEPIFEKYSFSNVTHADIYVFSGNVAITEMGGPALPFRTGRSDAQKSACPADDSRFSPDGRLPDADGRGKIPGAHIRDIFYRMGFNDREIVALSGAHGLGRCHTDRSGFWGPWTNAPTTFSNEYFRVLEELKWSKKFDHEGKKWEGPEQYENETKDLMMLPTDIALTWDPAFRKFVKIYKDDEDVFFKDFAGAWTKLTENGCKNLGDVVPDLGEEAESKINEVKANIAALAVPQKKGGWFW